MSVSGEMADALRKAATIRSGEPRAVPYNRAQGARDALKPFVDRVFDLEEKIEKLEDANYWREKHSGYGRGDSMG